MKWIAINKLTLEIENEFEIEKENTLTIIFKVDHYYEKAKKESATRLYVPKDKLQEAMEYLIDNEVKAIEKEIEKLNLKIKNLNEKKLKYPYG